MNALRGSVVGYFILQELPESITSVVDSKIPIFRKKMLTGSFLKRPRLIFKKGSSGTFPSQIALLTIWDGNP